MMIAPRDVYELADRHRLDAAERRRLESLAGFDEEPAAAALWVPRIVTVAGAALAGFALILSIAANWSELGRFGRFALIEAVLLATGIGAAIVRRDAAVGLALFAMLAIGGLFAYFGQTYQTGADPWQLFALWALLALPLCCAVRSDALWAPFALVAMAGIATWMHAHLGQRWRVEPEDFRIHGAGWIMAVALCAMLAPGLRRFTGAGLWSLRTAVTQAVILVASGAVLASFAHLGALQYWIGIVVLAVAVGVFALPEAFDVYALSAAALALDTLVVVALAHWMLKGSHGDPIGSLMLIGLVAAGLLAASVTGIMRLARRHRVSADAP